MNRQLHTAKVACKFPHSSYKEDYTFLTELTKTESNPDELINIYVNVHSPSYLRAMCEKNEEFLTTFLKQSPSWPLIRRVHNTFRTVLNLKDEGMN